MQLHENRWVYNPSILAQLHEGATTRCPDIGRMPGRAAAQLDRFLKYVMSATEQETAVPKSQHSSTILTPSHDLQSSVQGRFTAF